MAKPILNKFLIKKEDLDIPEIKELVAETERRVFLLIKTRWVFIGILAIYSIFAYIFYQMSGLLYVVRENYIIPAIAFLVILAYNTWYHFTYKWFSRIRGINQFQMIFDVFFVSLLIHYSGGILSWVWALYPLLIIEAAFLFREKKYTLEIAILCIFLYAGVLLLEYYQFLPNIQVPVAYGIEKDISYILLFLSWFSFILLCFAFIGSYLMDVIRQEEKEMETQVVIDALTNLYNRNYFFYRLKSEIVRSQRFQHEVSILLLDLDGFKNINDTLGHLEGDALLKKVADIFKYNIRRNEEDPAYDVDVPCRYGGDEFIIILPETRGENAITAAERLRKTIAKECNEFLAKRNVTSGKSFDLTISVGISSFPTNGYTTDELVKSADVALYKAKSEGKNKVVLAQKEKPNKD